MCAKQFISITAMFFMMNMVSAQDLLIASTSNTSPTDFLNDYTSVESDSGIASEADTEVFYDVPVQVSHFNWRTKSLEITEGPIHYTNAEVLDEKSNETLKSVKLTKTKPNVDMSDVPSGSYYLILTSDDGKVHSEKILIL